MNFRTVVIKVLLEKSPNVLVLFGFKLELKPIDSIISDE